MRAMPVAQRFLPLFIVFSVVGSGCSSDSPGAQTMQPSGGGSSTGQTGGAGAQAAGSSGMATGGGSSSPAAGSPGAGTGGGAASLPASVTVHLVPQQGVTGP